LYFFNIGIGGMMTVMGFFLYWQDKGRRMKRKGKVPCASIKYDPCSQNRVLS
jgi:hypothetical protein